MINAIYLIVAMVIILSLAAVGGSLSERAGIINLSVEGFMTIGAIIYAIIIGNRTFESNNSEATSDQFWIMGIASIATGLFASIYSFITVKLKANQTIAGIALNIFALALSIYIIHSKLNKQETDNVKIQDQVWGFVKDKSNVLSIFNLIFLLGLPIIAILFFLLNKTKYGIKLKSCGENPHAAASLGVRVELVQFLTVMLAGSICGLAGGMFAQLKFSSFYGSTQGIGFLAVAIVIFGQWRPSYIVGGAILFGGLYGLIEATPYLNFLNTIKNPVLLNVIPYVISIFVLVFTQRNSKAPKSLGIPYVNSGR